MTRKWKTAVLSLTAAFVLMLAGSSVAEAKTFTVDIDAPVVIGGQTFSGETLTFRSVGHSSLLSVDVDGRRVAVVEKPFVERQIGDEKLMFSFLQDAEGRWHLRGLKSDGGKKLHQFRVASVVQGDTPQPERPVERLASLRSEAETSTSR